MKKSKMYLCQKFNSCSVSYCPLDNQKNEREILPEERQCRLDRTTLAEIKKKKIVKILKEEKPKPFFCVSCNHKKQDCKNYLINEKWFALCPECFSSIKYTYVCLEFPFYENGELRQLRTKKFN